jgi:hypothetical protein
MSGVGELVEGAVTISAVIGALFAAGAILSIAVWFAQAIPVAASGEVPVEALTAMIVIATLASLPWWLPTG